MEIAGGFLVHKLSAFLFCLFKVSFSPYIAATGLTYFSNIF